jgi:hypothetical protein
MSATRVINRFLSDPARREFGEELVMNASGHVFGLPDTRLGRQTNTSVEVYLVRGSNFWGDLHSHPFGSRWNMLGDWENTLNESPQRNKIVVTPDSLFLLPAGQRISEMHVSEACGFASDKQ